ncbi:MAG: hypothetical protein WBF27_13365 [Xanthobacteraceae bacterium]
MNIIFVTGSDAAFFNSMLVGLQSFAERLPGQRLLVCDFGFTGAQAEFLRSLGVLLGRPPTLASAGGFHCKAALLAYLRHNGHDVGPDEVIVWLDADLTLMDVGVGDFAAVITAMASAGVAIAACPEPLGRSFGQMLSGPDASAMAPSARIASQAGMDFALPYLSSGLFFCRSAALLTRWQELTQGNAYHSLFEQNMFNVALQEKRGAFVALDCEEWQAQGPSLDKIILVPAAKGGRLGASIGQKNIKTLHTTSGAPGHLLIGPCRMTVRDIDLVGPFKLFMAEALRLHQLQLLASFVARHGQALMHLGICNGAARPSDGFEFVTL